MPQPRRTAAFVLAILVIVATSCASPERPVLTSDRIQEAIEKTPTVAPVATPTAVTLTDDAATDAATDDEAAQVETPETAQNSPEPGVLELLDIEVIETLPHDPDAWTQGLEVHDGQFLESVGLTGKSDLRRVDLTTGEVLQRVATPNDFFAEGMTKVGDEIIQITWRDNTAFYWDAETFELNQQIGYTGEGWGICYDGNRLIMSDGTPELTFRNPDTFEETGRVLVTFDGDEVTRLNELECVNGSVWANIWKTDLLVRIDPTTGVVTGIVDAFELERPDEGADVLNGIAWDASTETFIVTGKLWPSMYRVNFVPAATG